MGVAAPSLPSRSLKDGRAYVESIERCCEALSRLSEGGSGELGTEVRTEATGPTFEIARVSLLPLSLFRAMAVIKGGS